MLISETREKWNEIEVSEGLMGIPLLQQELGIAASYLEESSDFAGNEWERVLLSRMAATLRKFSSDDYYGKPR